MILRGTLMTACAALLAPAAAPAQWTVEASAGRAVHDPVAAHVSTTSASLGLAYEREDVGWGYLSGGAPLERGGPGWGAGGAGGWIGLRGGALQLGLSTSGHAYAYGGAGRNPSGGGGTLEVLPTLAWRRGRVSAEVSSGFAGAFDALGDSTHTRGFHHSGARLGVALAAGLTVGGEGRWVRGEGGEWPYAGGSAELRRRWGAAWAYAGAWLDGERPDPSAAYGAGVRVRVLPRTEVQASVRQEPFEPLYWNAPRRTWGVSLRRTLGREPRRAVPAVRLPHVSDGWAVFRLPLAAHAQPPAVIGDFSDWQPVAMSPEGQEWVARVRVGPGAHHYAFRLADGSVMVPEGVPSVDDGFGGSSAVLVVP
ncbi:MAG: glycogen-binding domain-containing protein [Gemmatimonadetes bacterium]|nr:glycogen-binding domain-containing protein [Gemmatimonadota bacterium]